MANDKGLIQFDEISAFVNYLNIRGIGNAVPKGLWQARAVFLHDGTYIIGYNAQNVVNTPPELRGLIEDFRTGQDVLTDTARLDFMLAKWRKVVCEVTPRNHEVYVEEGFMSDKTYPAVEIANEEWAKLDKAGEAAIKRQAIDLAIKNQKEKG